MARYILRRLAYSVVSLLLLSLTIFLFVRVTGDPALLLVEPGASQADIAAVRERFGLDQPILDREGDRSERIEHALKVFDVETR